MKTIQRTGILFLLLVFLCGVTGISVFEHVCCCQDETEITIFPEIFDHQSSCCCSEGKIEIVPSDHEPSCSLDKPIYCKNVKFYIKATITPVPVVENLFSFICFAAPGYQMTSQLFQVFSESADKGVFKYYTPSPISGQQRVIAYQQSKIPAPHLFLI